jgi:uncharacterized membrane protein
MRIAQAVLNFYVIDPGVWRADWAWGLPLIVLTVIIHVLGLGLTYRKAIDLFRHRFAQPYPTILFAAVISAMTLLATCLHAVEAGAWAVCYLVLGARPDFKSAMLYSLGAMTTYGHANLSLEGPWQLMGAIEALSGWLLFGLTAAFLFATVQKCHQISTREIP